MHPLHPLPRAQLRCIAPANATALHGGGFVVGVHVTLNGQQFSAALGGGYTHYAAVGTAKLSPDLGPSAGGTLIVLSGGGVGSAGSDRRCRFSGGDAVVLLPATAGGDGTLRCETPPNLGALGSHAAPDALDGAVQWVRLALSLNAQQFSNGSSFRAYTPPSIAAVTPGTGSYQGGTRLNVSLSQPAPDATNASHRMACRFGHSARDVEATMIDATHLRCVSPAAADAGVIPFRAVEFGSLPAGATLHGTAAIEGGMLRLTPVEGVGSFALELPNMGGASLSLSFDLLLGLGSAADGVSLVYGPLPPHGFDELGSGLGAVSDGRGNWMGGRGLEVSIRTHAVDLLQLAYDGAVFKQRKMHGVLRTSAFVNLSLSVDAHGHMVLSLGAGGAPAVLREEHDLTGWAAIPDSQPVPLACSRTCLPPQSQVPRPASAGGTPHPTGDSASAGGATTTTKCRSTVAWTTTRMQARRRRRPVPLVRAARCPTRSGSTTSSSARTSCL